MLVLTRRIGESVLIGDEIEVTVLDVKGDSIRIGIRAPRETRIQRAEIVDLVGVENASAAADAGGADVETSLAEAIRHARRE
ncbi:carbon storage regulator CsrA [Microbacterium sp. NPDC056234]|uniref:carbon storage regulator CsrA n=1 Tax=Microbacterium sp. NPDC056234 TaxID=3345757 RepID=UPI0035E256F9